MKKVLKSFIWITSLLGLALGGTHLVRVRTTRGMGLRSLKSFAQALAPFLGLVSAGSAALAAGLRMPLTGAAGLAGALLHGVYMWQVTRPQAECEQAFSEYRQPGMLRQRWAWRMKPLACQPRWERDVVYHTALDREGREIPLRCDLWQPPEGNQKSGAALLYVHGGGFFTSSKDFGTRGFFGHLAAQGHVIMDIDYRLGPNADLFEMLSDVKHALAWLKDSAPELGVDAERIVLAGGSAGAMLALLAAYAPDHPRLTPPDLRERDLSVGGVISYYGIMDLAALYGRLQAFTAAANQARREKSTRFPEHDLENGLFRDVVGLAARLRGVEAAAMRRYALENQALMKLGVVQAMARLAGGTPEEAPETYRLISPLTYAGKGCPPTLLLQGGHDYALPDHDAREVHARLRAAGVPAFYVELPWTEHTFDLFLPEISPPAQVALYYVERFLGMVAMNRQPVS